MEIKVGKYTIRSDRWCAYILEDIKVKEGKHKGEIIEKQVTGYHRDMGTLLDDFIDTKAKGSDAKTVKQVLADIDSALKDAKKIARESVKADFQIVRERK